MKHQISLFIAGILLFSACKKDDSPLVKSKYISAVFEYKPAPGQFVNTSIGDSAAAQKLVGSTENLLTLGAFGGYVTFGFDHGVSRFGIYSNAIASLSEPGVVMVSQDVNGNGLPDDAWYVLAGDQYSSAVRNYKITYYNPGGYADVKWKDNQGDSGTVAINAYHTQTYYPTFISAKDSVSFTGIKLPATLKDSSGYITNPGLAFGYADNWTGDYGTNGYNSFDVANAVDDNGNKVSLSSIKFVKVYTGQNSKGNATIGEISTEIRGAVDLSL
ncbi:hypothetical protein [Chitinophaga sancti]|uniref:PKD domain-containing protein n=1 Tax=Chitinophaga sancti TaxID=1004 RepID=A0A1K1NAY8_9BACT|nr:hypothetical protein [Chitinophaga sancti]WQD63405.1 hypothetical protein U0033_03280 [Chitinophaga sancti]WQG90969.1 hypothetical protein SR876_05635 [Chitinophaga sancti]SFW32413.1 hypothetical protein SAMN05661012_01119 [Chitinophaga sancti]